MTSFAKLRLKGIDEMSYLASCINSEILSYDGDVYSMANALCAVADTILDELRNDDE